MDEILKYWPLILGVFGVVGLMIRLSMQYARLEAKINAATNTEQVREIVKKEQAELRSDVGKLAQTIENAVSELDHKLHQLLLRMADRGRD